MTEKLSRRYLLTSLTTYTLMIGGCVKSSNDSANGTKANETTSSDAESNESDDTNTDLPTEDCQVEVRDPVEGTGDPIENQIEQSAIADKWEWEDLETKCGFVATDVAAEELGNNVGIDDLDQKDWIEVFGLSQEIYLTKTESSSGRVLDCPEITFEKARNNVPRKVTVTINRTEDDPYTCTHVIKIGQQVGSQD